ncbi:hypothetical protein BIW11_14288, partial [Tropilaelaps mercedesae]
SIYCPCTQHGYSRAITYRSCQIIDVQTALDTACRLQRRGDVGVVFPLGKLLLGKRRQSDICITLCGSASERRLGACRIHSKLHRADTFPCLLCRFLFWLVDNQRFRCTRQGSRWSSVGSSRFEMLVRLAWILLFMKPHLARRP